MRVFSFLLALAGASCSLPKDVDPSDKCVLKDGWGVFDADEYSPVVILTIVTKGEHTDVFNDYHGETVSTLSEKANGRYVLACKQASEQKTVKFIVSRPAKYTEFGAEWVKLFQKDSWKNETNEYEPFSFNKYGAKVPAYRDFHNDDGDDGPTAIDEGTLELFMEVSDIGDYEIMYGNPQFSYEYTDPKTSETETRWVAVQFRNTLLRVGSPWAECDDDDALPETGAYSDIGTIVPAFFGHPNVNLAAYKTLAADLKDSSVKVKVALEIFDNETKMYTMSEKDYTPKITHPRGKYSTCYEAGNACPEDHSVCKASFCELDTWEEIIRLFQDGGVEVLGAVGVDTTTSEYDILDAKVDGFYFFHEGTIETTPNSVYVLGEPLLKTKDINAVSTYVTLADNNLGVWNPYSWYPHIDNDKWAAIVDEVASDDVSSTVSTLFDRGYGYVFVTSQAGFKTSSKSEYVAAMLAAIEAQKTNPVGRRLQDREWLSALTYSWGCDDTRYHCSPICLAQDGPVTSIASDEKCANAPVDPCQCKCYYAAEWSCSNGEVVCQATKGIETMIVGDLLCENRGTLKPTFEEMSNQRQAGECEPLPTTRGEYPIEQCLTQWASPAPPRTRPTGSITEEPEALTEEPENTVAPVQEQLTLEVSFAAAASVLVALTQ
jgi:hypothetical protein